MAGPDRTTSPTSARATNTPAPVADQPANGNVALMQLAATGDLTPHAVAVVIARFPGDRDRILRFLQQHPAFGNRFVQEVVRVAQAPDVRVEAMEDALEASVEHARSLLAGNPARLTAAETAALAEQLAVKRSKLQSAAVNLATDDPRIRRADDLIQHANQLIGQLAAAGRAADAREATQADAASKDSTDVFAEAARLDPVGYCDRKDTPKETPPCQLDEATRREYRETIADRVQHAHTNWSLAILGARVDERFKKNELSFEYKLAEALFGLLFGLFERGAKAGLRSALSKAAKSKYVIGVGEEIYPGISTVEHVDTKTMATVHAGGDWAAKSGVGAIKSKLQKKPVDAHGQLSAAQAIDQARPELPADREGFLASIQSIPDLWASNLRQNLDHLYDEDLAALLAGLPTDEDVQLKTFQAKIENTLHAFTEQVEAVKGDARAVRVVNRHGVWKTALVAHEIKPDHALKGEWRDAETWTGNWKLVRWIDDDMAEMAVARTTNSPQTRMDLMTTTQTRNYWADDKATQQLLATFDAEEAAASDDSLLGARHRQDSTP